MLTAKRSDDFATTHNYDVQLPNGSTVQIYRDTLQFSYAVWYVVDCDGETSVGGYTKAETLAKLETLYPAELPVESVAEVAEPVAMMPANDRFTAVHVGNVAVAMMPSETDTTMTRIVLSDVHTEKDIASYECDVYLLVSAFLLRNGIAYNPDDATDVELQAMWSFIRHGVETEVRVMPEQRVDAIADALDNAVASWENGTGFDIAYIRLRCLLTAPDLTFADLKTVGNVYGLTFRHNGDYCWFDNSPKE